MFLVYLAGFSTNQRIVFAVTKYDQYYDGNKDEEFTMGEVQELVKEHLRQKFEINVQCEQIVPVCGQWALKARQLKKNCDDDGLCTKARQFLQAFMDRNACGENICVEKLDPQSVATQLETASNIAQLEKRLVI